MDYIKEMREFKTKNQYGYTSDELDLFLQEYPEINKDQLYRAMGCYTCLVYDEGPIIYFSVIENALLILLNNRQHLAMWD